MAKKMIKHGNSLAIIVDKPLLRALGIDEKTKVEISIEDGSLIVTPILSKKTSQKKQKSKIDKIADRVMDKYKEVFKKLAK